MATDIPGNQALWQAVHAVEAEIPAHLAATIDYYSQETGVESWTWFTLVRALASDPAAVTLPGLACQHPYTHPEHYAPRLLAGVAAGYLSETGGAYQLTPDGRAAVAQFVEDLRTVMVAVDPLSAEAGARLGELLARVVQASLDATGAAAGAVEPLRLRLSHRLMPAPTPALPYVEQLISCLAAWRDDCHCAAWQPSGLSGPAVEALTLFWRGQAVSLDMLRRRLAQRELSLERYRQALAELRTAGYLAGPDEAPEITAAGEAFRARMEADTDRFFFAAWDCLTASDRQGLHDLLIELANGLRGAEDM